MHTYDVILPAAGSGKRMGANKNKLLLKLNDKPILIHTLEVFDVDPLCKGIYLAIKEEERGEIEALIHRYQLKKVKRIVTGGHERQHSVYESLKSITKGDIVLVHDAARPFITQTTIHALIEKAVVTGAAIAGVRAKDTMKQVREDGVIEKTVDRSNLWIIQTPQAFRYDVLREAEDVAAKQQFLGTDEAMLVERLGKSVHIVESNYENVKVTTREDLVFGEAILNKRIGG